MANPIIRILGEPCVKSQPNLKQKNFSLLGLSQLTDVIDADLNILWWDNSMSRMLDRNVILGSEISDSLRREILEVVRVGTNRTPELSETESDRIRPFILPLNLHWKHIPPEKIQKLKGEDLKIPEILLEKAFSEYMAKVWAAVRDGGMAFVITPSGDNDGYGFKISDVIQRLEIVKHPAQRPPAINENKPAFNDAVYNMIVKLGDLIDVWPFRMGLRIGKRSEFENNDEIDIRLLCPEAGIKDKVRFFPVASDRQGYARALLMLHGQGALFAIPPPRSLDNLVLSFGEVWKAAPSEHRQRGSTTRGTITADSMAGNNFALVLKSNGRWRIRFKKYDGQYEDAEFKNTTGMRYLVALIEHPGQEVYATDLHHGYRDKNGHMLWVSAQGYGKTFSKGEAAGADMSSGHAMPHYRIISGSSQSNIQNLKKTRANVAKQIQDLRAADTSEDEPEIQDLIKQEKRLADGIKRMISFKEVNRDVKSVGRALRYLMEGLKKVKCGDFVHHLQKTIRPLEGVTLSYAPPPPGIPWHISWGTPKTDRIKGRK